MCIRTCKGGTRMRRGIWKALCMVCMVLWLFPAAVFAEEEAVCPGCNESAYAEIMTGEFVVRPLDMEVNHYQLYVCKNPVHPGPHTFLAGDSIPHSWVNGVCSVCKYVCDHADNTTPASCTEETQCSVCGGKIAPKGHSFSWKIEDGEYWQKCDECGYETAKKAMPAEIVLNGADRVCATQDYVFSFTLPEGLTQAGAGYEFTMMGSEIPLTEENGVYTGRIETTWYDLNDSTFDVIFSGITEDGMFVSYKKTVTLLMEHVGGTANCKEQAVCEVCGASYGDLNPDVHVGGQELKDDKLPSCTEEGYTGDTYCKGCSAKIASGSVIPAAGHQGGTANCKEQAACEVCGKTYGELNPAEHANLVYFPAKEATTSAEGNIAYWFCDGCGKYYADQAASKEIAQADTVIERLKEAELPKAEDPKAPQTGDESNVFLWVVLLGISGAAVVAIVFVAVKKKKSSK